MTTALGGRSSLPTPRESSNNVFLGPPSMFLGWDWVEQATNYWSNDSIPTLHTAVRSFSWKVVLDHFLQFTPQTLSKYSLPNEIPWSTFTWMILLLEWAASALFNGIFYWDCLGLFGLVVINWATCFDPTFLGDHDPKCREVSTCNIGSVWGCCHLSIFSPPNNLLHQLDQ